MFQVRGPSEAKSASDVLWMGRSPVEADLRRRLDSDFAEFGYVFLWSVMWEYLCCICLFYVVKQGASETCQAFGLWRGRTYFFKPRECRNLTCFYNWSPDKYKVVWRPYAYVVHVRVSSVCVWRPCAWVVRVRVTSVCVCRPCACVVCVRVSSVKNGVA